MLETEPPLTPGERLTIVALYTSLSQSRNRTVPGLLSSERSCYADHDIHRPTTLSHKNIPASRDSEGFGTC